MPAPTFFLLGAPKAGTTALYARLREVTGVYLPEVKEPTYFSDKEGGLPYGDEAAYLQLFDEAGPTAVVGEASPSYLHAPEAPARIAAFAPKARLVAVLRHPVERSFSHSLMLVHSGALAPGPFADRFEAASERFFATGEAPFGLGLRQSVYADALARYLTVFPREQLLVIAYDRLRDDPAGTFEALCAHIGVGAEVDRERLARRENAGYGLPRRAWLHRLIFEDSALKRAAGVVPEGLRQRVTGAVVRRNRLPKPALDPSLVRRLAAPFHDDIRRTEALTGLDLSAWRR